MAHPQHQPPPQEKNKNKNKKINKQTNWVSPDIMLALRNHVQLDHSQNIMLDALNWIPSHIAEEFIYRSPVQLLGHLIQRSTYRKGILRLQAFLDSENNKETIRIFNPFSIVKFE